VTTTIPGGTKISRRETALSRRHSSEVQHRGATVRLSLTRGAPMTTLSSRAAAAAFASLLLFASPVLAQTPAAKSDSAAPAATDKKAAKPHSAASIECSKEADAKGLHGKERKKFRSECKKAAAEKK
jgi:hypothetical protein